MKNLFNILLLLLVIVLSSSCYEDPWDHLPYPCKDGHCDVAFTIDTLVQPNTYLDENSKPKNFLRLELNDKADFLTIKP